MRPPALLLLMLLPLTGCAAEAVGALTAVELASVTVFGRGVVDMGVSAITGRDCSLVRLDRGKSYCAAPDVPPPETYCTRTLAAVDCWTRPPATGTRVGDTPVPNRAQAQYQAARWPRALTAAP